MPYKPNLPGSWGRSHSQGREFHPKGVTHKAREDELAMSRYIRDERAYHAAGNPSQDPKTALPIVAPGHRSAASLLRGAEMPGGTHAQWHGGPHEPRMAMTSSLPDLHGVQNTMYLVGAPTHPSAAGFNSKIHNWYHPMAKAHNDSLALSQGPRSWSADIAKSHDHIGYGETGRCAIGTGEVQITAISGEFPEWGHGPRTVPGPYGTQGLKGDRVGRFQRPVIRNGTMKTLVPNYKRGPNLSIVETFWDPDCLQKSPTRSPDGKSPDAKSCRSSASTATSSNRSAGSVRSKSTGASSAQSDYGWKPNFYGESGHHRTFGVPQFRAGIAQKSCMHGGSCNMKRGFLPYSNFVELDAVPHMHA
jgi:hypothetical protein